MKRRFKYLCITVIAFVCTLLYLTNISYAGSQNMNNLQYDVILNEDGSADITEIWDIEVYETNTLFKTFDLDSERYGDITNVKVSEIDENGQEKKFIKTDVYEYHLEYGTYYGLELSKDEFEIAWGVSVYGTEDKKYKITYTVNDAVKNYDDCSEFYWQFIGKTNGIPVDNINGTIKLPKALNDKENLKVWGHGILTGEIYAENNQTVTFNAKYLNAKTMFEVRVVTLENVFTSNTNIINGSKIDEILQEEIKLADEANKERERIKREQEAQDRIISIIVTGILIVVVVGEVIGLIALILKAKKYSKISKETPIRVPEKKMDFFRDFPDESATPGEAGFLYYYNKNKMSETNTSNIVSGTMLDLCLKKAISFVEKQKNEINICINDKYEADDLPNDEKAIYMLLIDILNYKNKKKMENSNEVTMKDIELYAQKEYKKFLAKIDSIEKYSAETHIKKENYNDKIKKEADKWQEKYTAYMVGTIFSFCFIVTIPLAIPCAINAGICNKIAKKKKILALTQKGINEKKEWEGLKRYMDEFSLLDERKVPELALWEKYLVYATAFGIADKVLKQLKVRYPEIMDENYMRQNGYIYIYMMSRNNLFISLDKGMQRAYSTGITQKAIAQSNYSSGSGGGGGFSMGGGRRRRPEAGMGGR